MFVDYDKPLNLNITTNNVFNSTLAHRKEIYLLSTDKLNCTDSLIYAPKIFLKSPDILFGDNCIIAGEVIFLSNPNTCSLYREDPLIAAYCSNHSNEI